MADKKRNILDRLANGKWLEHVRGFKAIWLWSLKIYELSDTRIHLANKLVSILVPQRRNVGGKFFIKFVVAVVV
ncbi:hypothetical protein ACLKA6_010548 [Drosophila palustris]